MRNLLFASLLLTILFNSCRKDSSGGDDPGHSGIDYTPIPTSEFASTEIMGYVTRQDQTAMPGSVFHFNSQGSTIMGTGIFQTGPVVTDKYFSGGVAEYGTRDYIPTYKGFPLTNSVISYVRVQMRSGATIGSVRNDLGGTFSFENGGSITYGTSTLYEIDKGPNSPAYTSPDIRGNIHLNYLNPDQDEFALRLPTYLAADQDGKRWFLKTYGGILFRMSPYGSISGVDIMNQKNAEVKVPIAQSMLTDAPDSVAAWKFVGNRWIADGKAGKDGNFYKSKITSATDYVFAVPAKGVYATLELRTADSATVPNTRIRIRYNNRVIAESVTDADGNAIFFVPSNEKLTAEILPDERVYSAARYQVPINSIGKSGNIRLVLTGNFNELTTISGIVTDCNGRVLVGGMARILLSDNREYFIPVKDGKFSSAVWFYGGIDQARVQVTDYAGGTQGEVRTIYLLRNQSQKLKFTTCATSTALYSYYKIDGKSYEVTDEATLPTVQLTAVPAPEYGEVTFKVSKDNKGVQFTVYPGGTGIYSGTPKDLLVDGVSFRVDPTQQSQFAYTRFDPSVGGYIEGWYSIYYFDASGKSHNVNGNFRVKRMF